MVIVEATIRRKVRVRLNCSLLYKKHNFGLNTDQRHQTNKKYIYQQTA
jgi:hypothetical protein